MHEDSGGRSPPGMLGGTAATRHLESTCEFQHAGKAARRSRIIHGPQIRYKSFFIDAPRVDGFLPGLEHHFRAAAEERLVETI